MNPNRDALIYLAHFAMLAVVLATKLVLVARDRAAASAAGAPAQPATAAATTTTEATAPYSRLFVALHGLAFGVMYFGIGAAVFSGPVPPWFPAQRVVACVAFAAAAGLMSWALVWFRSWRFRAKLEVGHELATGGPFALVRHPIYAAMNLYALGSAIWIPTPLVWAGFALMVLFSDIRARAEERLLERAFGTAYRDYRARTKRFLPGVY